MFDDEDVGVAAATGISVSFLKRVVEGTGASVLVDGTGPLRGFFRKYQVETGKFVFIFVLYL